VRVNLRGYFELIRPPNVMTAVADVLAGYAVAGFGNHRVLPWLIAATACLYAGGVTLNDFFDRRVDAAERPERPIPSGRTPAAVAAMLGGVLLAAGIGAASLATPEAAFIAAAIAAFVLLYDAWGKGSAAIAPWNMGLCRALNLMLGVAAVPAALERAWPLAIVPLVYIAAVTAVSRGEVHGGRRGAALFALISLSFVLAALAVISWSGPQRSLAGLALVALLAWRVWPPFWTVWRTPDAGAIRSAVRAGVLSLVMVDAVFGAAYAGPLYAAGILATAVVAGLLARLFSVT
jgi:4-hydroxybenzoate polyprenyltransferase